MNTPGTRVVSEEAILQEGAVPVLNVVVEPLAGVLCLAFGQAFVGVGSLFVAYVTSKATT